MIHEKESADDLALKRGKFVTEKAELQLRIGEINRQCSIRLPNHVYMALQRERLELNRRVQNCEQWILEFNSKQRVATIEKTGQNKSLKEHQVPTSQSELKNIVPKIYAKWLDAPETNFNKLDLLNDLKEIGLLVRKSFQ